MVKVFLSLLLAAFIVTIGYVLWQRQPKEKIPEKISTPPATQEAKEDNSPKLIDSPKNNSVLKSTAVKFNGNSQPNSYLAVYTNDNQFVIKTDASGKYEKELALQKGLNLINIQAFNETLAPDKNQNLTLFISDNPAGDNVFAGTVKTIFNPAITITTATGDKNAKTTKSTQIDTPKDDKVEATSTVEDLVRVGDFAITLGTLSGADNMNAQSLQIIRDNKPNNTESLTAIKTTGSVNSNQLTTTGKDNATQQFTLDKNTSISIADKVMASKDITKDKNAFIFYHTENGKNIADLIYLLP